MRNFFEGIPASLFESAEIDGCSPMGTFFKIVLPLSKAALTAIGLMFAVQYWNDYTNYKLYITNENLYNFQMKLRSLDLRKRPSLCSGKRNGEHDQECGSYCSHSSFCDHLSILARSILFPA